LSSKYADGHSCDCGCGALDPDCKDRTLASCDACNVLGGCADSPCPSDIVPDDNTRCALPVLWVCNPIDYGDGICDCGCGAPDVDCDSKKAEACAACPILSCAQDSTCAGIDPDDNTICTLAPRDWKCDARAYRDGSECDCGCDFWDPDCSSREVGACDSCNTTGACSHQACPATVAPEKNEACIKPKPPGGWTCPEDSYGDGAFCDCGCGVPDPDCGTSNVNGCYRCACGICPDSIDPNDLSRCAPAPAGWTCPPEEYANGTCHCGCGVPDPGCAFQDNTQCEICDGCAHGNCLLIDSQNISKCGWDTPSTWTCSGPAYGDGVCECGCGAPDPVCKSALKSACGSCSSVGSCSDVPCDDPGSTIKANDNSSCSQ
jgi:hypothetical protein